LIHFYKRIKMLSLKLNAFTLTLLLLIEKSYCQLIGSRGVIILPDGVVYRDEETLQASMLAANFARSFQSSGAVQSEELRFVNNAAVRPQQTNFYTGIPSDDPASGGELPDTEVFDFVDSRYLQPLAETRFNKGLEELEAEKIINGGSTASRDEVFRMPLATVSGIPSSSFAGGRPQGPLPVAMFTTASPLVNFGPLSRPRPGRGFGSLQK